MMSWLGAWKRVEQAIPEPRVAWVWPNSLFGMAGFDGARRGNGPVSAG
jgi:hypothetical protein